MSEKSLVTKVILAVALVALALTISAFVWLHTQFPLPKDDVAVKVQYLEQYVAVLQILAVGVLAAILTVIIPLLLPEARDRFERYKESRKAYSRAKTAVIYLPDRVANAADMKEAIKLVEEAHRELHFAETFENVIIDRGYLAWFANPHLWVLYNYWQISAVAEVLRKSGWSAMEDRGIIRVRLSKALKVVHNYFGERGEKRAGEKWIIKVDSKDKGDVPRFEKEGELKEAIEHELDSLMSEPGSNNGHT